MSSIKQFVNCYPANTPRGFHVETTWKRPFPRRFNVESTWCVCGVIDKSAIRIRIVIY